ncbi:MAG: cytochrome c peroxidase [Bacteroidota bacterium]
MTRKTILFIFIAIATGITFSFQNSEEQNAYSLLYQQKIQALEASENVLLTCIDKSDLQVASSINNIKQNIQLTRNKLKGVDFWLRYLEPLAQKKINGPLPVEWETEVFEKFEKPYKREGAGLTLALQYLEDEEQLDKKVLAGLIQQSIAAIQTYYADSITKNIKAYHHFFLCNRLYLLNLATIYTSGFECPDTASIIPELYVMLNEVNTIYTAYNQSYANTPIGEEYLALYQQTIQFVKKQATSYSLFNHYAFIRNYVNPLFALNQQMLLQYKVVSRSFVDYTLNKQATSIFSKNLYQGQNAKGIFLRVNDEKVLEAMDNVGKLLFYDPILSANNLRSCVSCHNPKQFFTDTATATSLQFDQTSFLTRNTPTLINAAYNHLIMLDGKHISLQHQTKGVLTNPAEMASNEKEMVAKVLSCNKYKEAFEKLLPYTPLEKEITADHIASVITYYYSKFSQYTAPFDAAMNKYTEANIDVQKGFNLFMSKAQCGTCHFAPQFNGVKPPYVSSEFEVLGVPSSLQYDSLSADKGRYLVNPAEETLHAFRTGTIRNAQYTAPYMHNGVFKNLEQVIDFYNAGGGAGKGLQVPNQTLPPDSLQLNPVEKKYLIAFIQSLNEQIQFEVAPQKLPKSTITALNNRRVGGTY